MAGSQGKEGHDLVASVLKACSLLGLFDTAHPVWALSELTSASGLNKTTVHRLMSTMIHAGWVNRAGEGSYRIALSVFEIGSSALNQLDIRAAANPLLAELARTFGDTAFLMVPAEGGAVCIDRQEGHNPLLVAGIPIGSVLPYHAAAGPMVMLAYSPEIQARWITDDDLPAFTESTLTDPQNLIEHLGEIRKAGFAVSKADHMEGVAAVAAPVLGEQDKVVASISIGGRADSFEGAGLNEKIRRVRDAASYLSRVARALPS